jgi:hypothetical protein
MEACVDLTTCLGVPGPSLGNPPVVVFCLGLGGVPEGGPVAGQHSGTLAVCRELTHLTLRAPVLGSRGLSPSRSALQLGPQGACGRQKVSRWSPTTSNIQPSSPSPHLPSRWS